MYIATKSLYTVSSMFKCEYCGQEIESDKAKDWEERHKHWDGVEFRDTIRRHYYSINEDSDEVCPKCYRKLLIKKILIRLLSWGLSLFFIVGLFIPQKNPLLGVVGLVSLVSLFTLVFNRSFLYSVVGFLLSPFLGQCEMHPFGNEYTIRERREEKVPISVKRRLQKVKKYLKRRYRLSEFDADSIIVLSEDIELDMIEEYGKYKHMNTKELAQIIASNSDYLKSITQDKNSKRY